ncbi:LIC_10091 family protein [Nocardia sienata]|uniref:LIC_10091 family protein n=1 Tax=Nocardia sienata TaxID=248552 RepID=UPI0007A558FE|nr:hypothetical protein [Nocardia sienata]
MSTARNTMTSFAFGDVVRSSLAAAPAPSNYTEDCFVTSELGYSDVIAKCRPAPAETTTGAFVGVGPCQNLTYVGALRPRLALICDSRPDNLLEHLIFKMLVERAADPLDYLLLLFSRTCPQRPPAAELRTPRDLVDAFENAVISPALYDENLALLRSTAARRWGLQPAHTDRIDYLYGEFFRRQLDIFVFGEKSDIGEECPTMRDILLATTSTGWNFHFLTDPSRFDYVRQMHLRDRIIPVLGNLCEPDSISLLNDLLEHFGETADTVYLSNIEDHILSRYVLWPDGSVTDPNPDALITDEYRPGYARLVDALAALRTNPEAILIRFFHPGRSRSRHVGVLPYLDSTVCRLKTFFASWRAGPVSLFDTYL